MDVPQGKIAEAGRRSLVLCWPAGPADSKTSSRGTPSGTMLGPVNFSGCKPEVRGRLVRLYHEEPGWISPLILFLFCSDTKLC